MTATSSEGQPAATMASDAILLAQGRALQGWARIETELLLLFCYFQPFSSQGPKAGAVPLIVFNAVQSAEARLRIVNALAKHWLADSPLLQQWEALSKKLDNTRRLRNRIAHWAIYRDGDKLYASQEGPAIAESGDLASFTSRYSAKDIASIADGMMALAAEVRAFHQQVARHRRPEA